MTPEGAVMVNYETLSKNPSSLYQAIAAAFGSHPDCLVCAALMSINFHLEAYKSRAF